MTEPRTMQRPCPNCGHDDLHDAAGIGMCRHADCGCEDTRVDTSVSVLPEWPVRTARTIVDRRDFLVQVGNDDTHWETCNHLTLRQAANPAERKDAMQRSRNVYGAERDGVPLDVRVVEELHVATELDRL